MGNPVAFEAKADERDTRGFISMTRRRPSGGLPANWMFAPPVSTPTRRMQAKASSRMAWYSTSDRVWAGATVIESPVWTPMGSKFSIEQTTTQLSTRSRMNSRSYSFQPAMPPPPPGGPLGHLGPGVGRPRPGPAQDEAGADHEGEADALAQGHGFV